ncbi:uncharacterized protein METZ01_LOCUS485097, partial [marine metagenome]
MISIDILGAILIQRQAASKMTCTISPRRIISSISCSACHDHSINSTGSGEDDSMSSSVS